MNEIIELINKLPQDERQDFISYLMFTYPEECKKATQYIHWPGMLNEVSNRLKKALNIGE